jgi:hypothetical protein
MRSEEGMSFMRVSINSDSSVGVRETSQPLLLLQPDNEAKLLSCAEDEICP